MYPDECDIPVYRHVYLRNEEAHIYKIHQILFAYYLWPWLSLPSFGRRGYVLPDVDDPCHVYVVF